MQIILTTESQLDDFISKAISTHLSRALELKLITKSDESHLPEILNVQQAAEVLDLAPSTVYGLVNKSKLPHFKKGHKLRFKRSQLLEWINSGEKKTSDQVEHDAQIFTRKPSKR